jgi:hypothetical protein
MKTRDSWSLLSCACLLVACAKSSDATNGAAGSGGSAHAGSSGSAAHGGSGAGGSGAAGAAGGKACPDGIAIPTLCRVCADGSCGTPSCSAGKFTGFVCPEDAAGGSGGNGAALHWVVSCGSPVCQGNGFYDDPNIPNCTTEKEGDVCQTQGQRCDGVAMCGATLLCASKPPQTCPISRARYKQQISYLNDAERDQYHEQITQLRLASYRYTSAPNVPQLGFMIDDVEPSVAVAGDHVNLYAYLSMAVAAIQVQDRQIKALQRELEQLRASRCQVPWRCDSP